MKKLLISLLASILLFTNLSFAYEDVPSESENFYAIEYLRRNDVIQETKFFHPDTLITKAEFVKYLVRLNNPDFVIKPGAKLPFEDTEDNKWYAPYFQEAIKLGILSDRNAKAEPYKKLTVVNALELVFHSQSIPIPKKYVGEIPYEDVKRNKAVAPLIMRALEFDLIKPKDQENVGIYKRITREEAARMIYKMDLVNLEAPSKKSSSEINSLDFGLRKIISAWELIHSNYVNKDDVDYDKLSDEAISAMTNALGDTYSTYLDETQNTAFSDDLDGEIEGIGAYIGLEEEGVTIITPMEGSPAKKAGVKAGDVVKKVDDTDTEGMGLMEVVNLIKGPKGTKVKIEFDRNGNRVTLEIVRDKININAIEYETKDNGKVMYIKLSTFNQNAAKEFQDVANVITANKDIKGIILDLRNNPGGLLDAAVRILNNLLKPSSAAVHVQYNYFKYTQYTTGGGELTDYPMVVLVNKGSASASEIVAGALKDYGLATIVGETTFGKGTVQEVNYFTDQTSLKLTVAKWLTPLNHSIQDNGVEADIQAVDNDNTSTDEALNAAMSEIRKLMK